MKYKIIIVGLLAIACCNMGCRRAPTARIYERQEANGNKLQIKYTYLLDGKQMVDSATIDNVALPGDSINVKRLLNRLKKQ